MSKREWEWERESCCKKLQVPKDPPSASNSTSTREKKKYFKSWWVLNELTPKFCPFALLLIHLIFLLLVCTLLLWWSTGIICSSKCSLSLWWCTSSRITFSQQKPDKPTRSSQTLSLQLSPRGVTICQIASNFFAHPFHMMIIITIKIRHSLPGYICKTAVNWISKDSFLCFLFFDLYITIYTGDFCFGVYFARPPWTFGGRLIRCISFSSPSLIPWQSNVDKLLCNISRKAAKHTWKRHIISRFI